MYQEFKLKRLILFFSLIFSLNLNAQFTASGKISDENGNPLTGVAVQVKGTTIGTYTDLDGKYSLEVPGSSAILVIAYLGYADIEKAVNAGESMQEITLSGKATVMDEVIVSGLATSIKRSNAANAVAFIDSRDLQVRPSSKLWMAPFMGSLLEQILLLIPEPREEVSLLSCGELRH